MGNSPYMRDVLLRATLLSPDAFPELFISLHTADPGEDGNAEITGRGYHRQAVELGRAAPGAAANQNTLEYSDLPRVDITHFGLWDAPLGGRFLLGGQLVAEVEVHQAGESFRWRSGEFLLRVG